ncbi:succinyl-diaminopimelate desuccinylase [Anaeromyxobacter diazotrophicus]|uniref:succinyl-diaminopimelate desuccinylase n=1 Tax=Anaeromyxobacter diazotrophicus TaxID=2590199 RepID=UPI0015919ADA
MTGPGALGEALAARTEALCAVRSVIGEERALCDALEREARARFPAVERVKNSLVVWVDAPPPSSPPPGERAGERGRAATDRPLVLLCGHLDTVPIHAADEGRFPRREGERLVAPGASDMKSGVAVALELAERLPRAGRDLDLGLVLYAREEGPFEENELGDLLRDVPALRGAALAVCLEPTDGAVQLGCVGSLHATVTFTGRSAHSARPWHGENAVHKAGALLAHLAGRAPREAVSGGLVFREVISATRIEGGRARNVVPDRCTLNLNFRFAPDKSLEAAAEELRALARDHGGAAEVTDLSPACPPWADHPLVRRLLARTGAAAEPKQAWTDVARLAQAGIPAVNFGPGATSQAHQAGEWVELAAIERCYRALEAFLRATPAA